MPVHRNRIYALLAGINDYSPPVGKLRGCLNDVDHFTDWLTDTFDPRQLHLEVLKDSDATRGNIIRMFRSHLSQAGPDDIVLFQYSGHGARCKSAQPFKRFYPDGKDEGLVCYDSRESGGFDLADKELAVLLTEVARNDPHIALLLDCCHSGSATRGADDFTQARARVTHEVHEERPLETYLEGYYAARLERGESLEIPASRHILLAACERVQKAWEGKDSRGVFSTTLLDVLGQSGNDITYADLFMRARSAVRRYADDQTPQFETYQGFDAYNGFLGGATSHTGRRYSVYFDKGAWQIDAGALHGLPADADKAVEVALYPERNRSTPAGHAETVRVGAQRSELRLLDLDAAPSDRFQARVTSLPVPPLEVALEGDNRGIGLVRRCLDTSNDQTLGFKFSDGSDHGSGYLLRAANDGLRLHERGTDRLIDKADGYTEAGATHLFSVLKRVAAWERALALQNSSTRLKREAVTFQLVETHADGTEDVYTGDEIITMNISKTKDGSDSQKIVAKLRTSNGSAQVLHFALAVLSNDFSVKVRYNDRIEPTGDLIDLPVTKSGTFKMGLGQDEGDQATHFFQLIVSTERIDDFLLEQARIEISKPRSALRGMRSLDFDDDDGEFVHENEWFTKTIRVKLVRQFNRVSTRDIAIPNRPITIKGHPNPAFTANISLCAAQSGSRSAGGDSDFYRALERQGMEMVNLSGTRGEAESILELTDIQNPDVLKEQPLEIELDLGLAEDEHILPLTFDGEDILLAGEPEQDADSRTLIHIDHIPDGIPEGIEGGPRSLGKALKLYFFKTYLKRSVNKLCWVEYRPDGSVERHEDGVDDKVAATRNILLLVHGIIGDTEVIAQGLPQAIDANGTGVHDKFDLVLTYDYENLSTGIEATARRLKTQLREIGLHEHDDKRLILLVHSMGGLVSRWFIEQESGDQVVDHLVMCGTPNTGSPFGKIDSARNLTSVLTTLAMNTFPLFAPFGAGLLTVLGRSRKISPMLEQMNPKSDFIQELNAGGDPGVRYTILAGDVRDYEEESDGLVARLTAKIGKGALFDAMYQDAGHDIAVASASIQGVPDPRQPEPARRAVACHHLNYFVSDAGLAALGAVKW